MPAKKEFKEYAVFFQKPDTDTSKLSRVEIIALSQRQNKEFEAALLDFINRENLQQDIKSLDVAETISCVAIRCTENAIKVIAQFPGIKSYMENRTVQMPPSRPIKHSPKLKG